LQLPKEEEEEVKEEEEPKVVSAPTRKRVTLLNA
jgi:hypothetical protein